jgi:hypothetical protein
LNRERYNLLQLLLKNEERLFDVAMFLVQEINNHGLDLRRSSSNRARSDCGGGQ